MTWVLTLLGIMALIVLHELGHFAVAKAVGMRVERFSLFFPPRLFGRKIGETDYSVGAIPAGGYVKITGMTWLELEGVDLRIAVRAYALQPPWKRAAVILAGPVVNIVIAFLLFWLVLSSGSFNGAVAVGKLDRTQRTLVATTSVALVEKGEPATGVLRAGDRIVTVEGRRASANATTAAISSHRCAGAAFSGCVAATPVLLTVSRAGREAPVSIYPRYDGKAKRMRIGIGFGAKVKHLGVLTAMGVAAGAMWHITTGTVTNFGEALTSSEKREELHSIVGITQVGNEEVASGPALAFVFLGFLSLALAVINLFPFLPLDGGHLVWSIAEKVRGRRISLMAMYRFSSVGIVLMLFLVVSAFSNDISNLTG